MTVSDELTIAICTHNRVELLTQLIDRLGPQAERVGVRILVVDSASRAEVAREVAALVEQHVLVDLIRLDTPGVSLARNAALEAATTPWLAYIDDDELPAADWVDEALQLCRRLPEDCAACGGYSAPLWPAGMPLPAIGWRWRQHLSLCERKGEFDQSDRPHFVIGHSIVRVSALEAAGGFDLRLGREGGTLLSGEESLLATVLLRLGWRIWYSDRLWLEHAIEPERLTRDWAVKRAYWEGISRARVLRLSDPDGYRQLCRQTAMRAPVLRLLAGLAPTLAELDLRYAFAAGVNAERRQDAGAGSRPAWQSA